MLDLAIQNVNSMAKWIQSIYDIMQIRLQALHLEEGWSQIELLYVRKLHYNHPIAPSFNLTLISLVI